MDLRDYHAMLRDAMEDRAGVSLLKDCHDAPRILSDRLFAERAAGILAESGMTPDAAEILIHETPDGRGRVSGWVLSDGGARLDLLIVLLSGGVLLEPLEPDSVKDAVTRCLVFFKGCADGSLERATAPDSPAYGAVAELARACAALELVRVHVVVDGLAEGMRFRARRIAGKAVAIEVVDVRRLHELEMGGADAGLEADFPSLCGSSLPCLRLPRAGGEDYECVLTAIPGEVLRHLYELHGNQLMQANIRAYLGGRGKVNRKMAETLKSHPERFLACNNGLAILADDIIYDESSGGCAISRARGLRIVNGGQTTASIFFFRKKHPRADLTAVRVPAKLIVLGASDAREREILIDEVSLSSNSQNAVKQADLSSNRLFHRTLESVSLQAHSPDGGGKWFYERTTGGHAALLATRGTTRTELQKAKAQFPAERRITKTELAKCWNAWERKPHVVALGEQKNFLDFMGAFEDLEEATGFLPDGDWFRGAVARTILFRKAHALAQSLPVISQSAVAAYVVALVAENFRDRMRLDLIWKNQAVSPELSVLLERLIPPVFDNMRAGCGNRLLSEWAKNPRCWENVRIIPVDGAEDVPELA